MPGYEQNFLGIKLGNKGGFLGILPNKEERQENKAERQENRLANKEAKAASKGIQNQLKLGLDPNASADASRSAWAPEPEKPKSNTTTYIIIGVLLVVVILVVYFFTKK